MEAKPISLWGGEGSGIFSIVVMHKKSLLSLALLVGHSRTQRRVW